MIDIGVLVDKLNGFETSEEIADFLISQEIQAKPQKPESCAISKWVRQESGQVVCTYINKDYSTNTETGEIFEGDFIDTSSKAHRMTETVGKFIREFDRGDYPELIEPGTCYINHNYY